MRNVAATEFKAKCLELMDRVAEGRETYVITKRGRPVAKLVPADPPRKQGVLGCMLGKMEIVGDLEQPPWTQAQWKQFERERAAQWQATDERPKRRSRGKASGPGR